MADDHATRDHAALRGDPEDGVETAVEVLDAATWRLTATSGVRSPVVSYLVAGERGALLVDPGSLVTWPATARALASVGSDLDIRWVFGHSAAPAALGALPSLESTLGSDVILVTSRELIPAVSHYVTRMPIQVLDPGAVIDIGGRQVVVATETGDNGATVLLLRDTRSGMVFGGGVLSGEGQVPRQLESVRSALEHVLQTTLAPIAIEGRALAALAPIGRVTSLRLYLREDDVWFELCGREGLLGRQVPEPPPPTSLTLRLEFSDPAQIVLDFTVAEESAWVVEDPGIRGLAQSLHRPLVSSLRRILTMREAEQASWELREDTRRDPLTGIGNRRALQGWTSSGRFAALMIDLDRFKQVNDEFGHRTGDTVLRLVADVIGSQIRGEDLLVRYGGDEFLALLDGVDWAVAEVLADRIRTSVSGLDSVGLSPIGTVTVSIGVADGTGPVGDVIARADSALYRAKANGRDTVCVATANLDS